MLIGANNTTSIMRQNFNYLILQIMAIMTNRNMDKAFYLFRICIYTIFMYVNAFLDLKNI